MKNKNNKNIPNINPMSSFYVYEHEIPPNTRVSNSDDCEKCDNKYCDIKYCLITELDTR
jgi:hypothetical protein